jgi:hypothetical protein
MRTCETSAPTRRPRAPQAFYGGGNVVIRNQGPAILAVSLARARSGHLWCPSWAAHSRPAASRAPAAAERAAESRCVAANSDRRAP